VSKRAVLHRESGVLRYFIYRGVRYDFFPGGPRGSGWEAYEICRASDGLQIADNFYGVTEVRKFLQDHIDNDWDMAAEN
jgi:hypothetical protein